MQYYDGVNIYNRSEGMMEELNMILERFAASVWDLIAVPSRRWLEGSREKAALISAIRQAEQECGSCGCDLDPLYQRALELL